MAHASCPVVTARSSLREHENRELTPNAAGLSSVHSPDVAGCGKVKTPYAYETVDDPESAYAV